MIRSRQSSLVVYADLPHLMNDNVLNREYTSRLHGGQALTDMAEAILLAGFEFMTIDRYLKACPKRKAMLITHMATGLNLNQKSIIPAICYSLESPIIASRYYHHIRAKTKSFAYLYDWSGVMPRIDGSRCHFLPISWPANMSNALTESAPWGSRRFLVMINSNKRALQWAWPGLSLRDLIRLPKAAASNMRTTWIKSVDPFMRSELYLDRLQAIKFFSKCNSFDLFGELWDLEKNYLDSDIKNAIARCYRGTIPARSKLG